MSQQIQLSQGQVALVDDEDFERINAHKWHVHKDRDTGKFYAVRSTWTCAIRKKVYMAREILNAPPEVKVDHLHSEDTLDNRKSNLRMCTTAQNACNRGKDRDNTSGYKGVGWFKRRRKWSANIGVNGKLIFLGHFDTAEAAASAYDNAARNLHGEFANTNFP